MIKNSRGITLIELLCALTLLSLILIVANSVTLFGLNQVNDQTNDFNNQTNVRIAIGTITKEVRSAQNISVSNNVLTINNKDVYKLDHNTLTKNGQPFVPNIQKFEVTINRNQISLSIADIPAKGGKQISLSDTIYSRE